MRRDSRLSRVLHVLLHMAHSPVPLTSEKIAAMLNTNPVVIRRTLGNLLRTGYVTATKGHGGGWTLARPLAEISLFDVYQALEEPEIFALGLSKDSAVCRVEKAVNEALSESLVAAENVILGEFRAIKLSHIATQVHAERCL